VFEGGDIIITRKRRKKRYGRAKFKKGSGEQEK